MHVHVYQQKRNQHNCRDTGDITTDTAAAEDLIRQYRKEKGVQRVAAGRGLAMVRRGSTLFPDLLMHVSWLCRCGTGRQCRNHA